MKYRWFFSALRFSGLFAAIVLIGLLLGAMVAILPPMAGIGVVGLIAAILIWVTPEMNQISIGALRRVFRVFLVSQLCIPAYYAVQLSGMPWISLRRISGLLLIVMFSLMVGTSLRAREAIVSVLSRSKSLAFCVIGFLVMAFNSIFTSVSPIDSLSHFSDAMLNWYIPMFACLLVVESAEDIVRLCKLLGIIALFVALVGIAEFVTERSLAIELIPKSLRAEMLPNNLMILQAMGWSPIRNGLWRASSIFNGPLSFGEFAVMVAPIGAYFIAHSSKSSDRVFGIVLLGAAMLCLFVSGSRGGSIGFVISMPMFAALWIIRYARGRPHSLVGAISSVIALVGTISMIAAIFLVGRLHNIVLGGGDTVASNEGRLEQWSMGIPHIISNPVTGHGFGLGGEVVGWVSAGGTASIDSYVLTVLVETGVPGLVFFFGAIAVATFYCINIYLDNPRDGRTAIAAPLACSMVAFGFYRIALSQKENHTLFFIFLGLVFKIMEYAPVAVRDRISPKPVGLDSENTAV